MASEDVLCDSSQFNSSFEKFCGEPFMNFSNILIGSTPQFTGCFQHTVLIWIPCFVILISSIYIFLRNRKLKTDSLPWTWLNVTKLIICGLLCAIWIAKLVWTLIDQPCVHPADYVSSVCMILSLAMEFLLFLFLLRKAIVSSALVFLSWIILIVCGCVEFAVGISNVALGQKASPQMIGFSVYYILAVVEFVLLLFPDKRADGYVKEKNACPRDEASFANRLLYVWFWPTAILGWKRSLTRNDLWALSKANKSALLQEQWEHYWFKQKRSTKDSKNAANGSVKYDPLSKPDYSSKENGTTPVQFAPPANTYVASSQHCPSIPYTLFMTFKGLLIPSIILNLCQICLQFVSPQVLKILLNFIQSATSPNPQPLWFGIAMALVMFVCACLQSLLQQQQMNRMWVFGMRLKSVLTSTIYKKSLRLSNSARRHSTVGEIVNHMAVDVQRLVQVSQSIQMVWSTPIQICLALFFLYQIIEWAALAGFVVMLILIPINFTLSKIQKKNQIKQLKFKDDRIRTMSEILNGIRVLKLYAWEIPFEKKITQIRAKELEVLRKSALVQACNVFTMQCAPFLVAVVSFATYTLAISPDGSLSPQVAFVSLSLFNILRMPLNGLPAVISSLVQASVSNKRLRGFLSLEEIDDDVVDKTTDPDEAVSIKDASFMWDRNSEKVNLENINLSIKKGQMVAIVGQVGEGKSSLLAAILGEIDKIKGSVATGGSIAYVPQQAWIRNTSLKQNVTFTKDYEDDLYTKVINACALKDDLAILPAGDETEIGEKGINLSGGQKQRVSLARSVYQQSDIYLLDDPLSAVDAHVGRHIFDNVISNQGLLKNKTRILVTHGLTYLKFMDNIIVLKDGKISETGTFKELIQKGGAFAEFLDTYLIQLGHNQDASEEEAELLNDPELVEAAQIVLSRRKSSIESTKNASPRKSTEKEHVVEQPKDDDKKGIAVSEPTKGRGAGRLVRDEKVAVGRVTWKVYQTYAIAIGYLACIGVVFCFVASSSFGICTNLWLAAWSGSENVTTSTVSLDARLGVYFALGITQGIFIFLATILNAYATVSASMKLHKALLQNLLRVPTSFYDVTPLGAVINRVGKDVDVMDNTVPGCVRQWIMAVLSVLSSIILIMIATPIFAVVILPMGLFYFIVQRFYLATARQLKRLEAASRSPIFSFFGETLQGLSTIRAYAVPDFFIEECEKRIDNNQMAYYPMIVSSRWLAVYLQFIGNCLVLFAALFAVLDRKNEATSLAGLSITYALTMTQALLMGVRASTELETNIVSVERIKEYADIPPEAEWETDVKPPKNWPQKGEIQFVNYCLRYRKNLDLVLKGVDCSIGEMEKIGIVGRTGAGKSSLSLALFRMIEPADGTIIIDNVDVRQIGLHDLRSKLAIIPQDPVLFSGPLRSNLDPFGTYSDSELWNSLEQAHLKNFVSTLPDKLEHFIIEGGSNLSVGQRQLICLARALLRNSKILIFDEATAAIDMETEALIQQTVQTYFKDCTMLTIAHRLNTILNSDRVMVMSQGQILEMDKPSNLLENSNSAFYKMAKDAKLL